LYITSAREHPFERLILWNADEVLEHQLRHLVARGVDEIAVTVVDEDEVALGIEARAFHASCSDPCD